MTEQSIKTPAECLSLQDIRTQIDRLDAKIAPLLCQRIQYIHKAAEFKATIHDVRLPDRIEEIITKVTKIAEAEGVDTDYIEMMYRILIDESIRQEKAKWVKNHQITKKDSHAGI